MTKAELDFRQALRDYCHKSGIELGELSGLDRRNRKVMTLLTENGSDILRILYVKYSKYPSPKGFWGFPRLDSNVITTIRGAAREWVLVLLLGDGKHCYVGTSEMAEQAIDKLTPVEDGNYRLHENDIRDWLQIDNRADLFDQLLRPASSAIRSRSGTEDDSFDIQERAAGFQSNPEIRLIIELHAMARAKKELEKKGYRNFADTSANRPYDYKCKKDGKHYFVEVKGTQGPGASVILTRNEVDHWKKHQNESIAVIVHGVKLNHAGESLGASGGTARVCFPWKLEQVEPIQYKWTVSGCP